MWAAYTVSAAWAAGCLLAAGVVAFQAWRENTVAGIVAILLGVPLALLLGLMPWAMVEQSKSPTLATLKKNEWACVQERDVWIDGVNYPECVVYTRTR